MIWRKKKGSLPKGPEEKRRRFVKSKNQRGEVEKNPDTHKGELF